MAIDPTKLPDGKSQEAVKNLQAGRDITLGDVHQQIIINEGQKAQLIYSDPLPDLRHFQGRKDELADLYSWLKDGAVSLIGVRGEGGIGKSMLTAKAFASCAGFQVKFLADVRTNTPITSLAGRALKELGVPLAQVQAIEDKDLPQRLLRHLQTGRYLLVIDNMESLLSPEGEWQSGYGEFLNGCQDAGLKSVLLLASREYPQHYFGWQRSQWLMVEKGLSSAEGGALLRELEVEGADGELASVSADVRGNPLALSLVAGWIRQEFRPGRRSISRLAESTDLFQITGRHRGESDLSVDSVLRWSLDRLTDTQRYLLTQITVLRGEFSLEAVQALVPGEECVVEILKELERRSLLQALVVQSEFGELVKYRLQSRISDYGKRIAGDVSKAHERAIQYFWNRRRQRLFIETSYNAALEYVETFYHEMEIGRIESACQTVLDCDYFLRRSGQYQVLLFLYEQLYRKCPNDLKQRNFYAVVCNNLSSVCYFLGRYQSAIDYQKQSLVLYEEFGDQKEVAGSLSSLGSAYNVLGQYQKALEYYDNALFIHTKRGHRLGIARALTDIGMAYHCLGDYWKALEYHQKAIAQLAEVFYEANPIGICYPFLGQPQPVRNFNEFVFDPKCIRLPGSKDNRSFFIGQPQQASDSYLTPFVRPDRNLEIWQDMAGALGNLGLSYQFLGKYHKAIDCHHKSLDSSRELGNRKGIANSLGNLGIAHCSLGQYSEAIEFYQQSLKIKREMGDLNGIATSLGSLGTTYNALKKYEEAIEFHQQSLAIKLEIGERQGIGKSFGNLGISYQMLKKYEQANNFFQDSLKISREIGDRHLEATSLTRMSQISFMTGRPREACISSYAANKIYLDLKFPSEAWPLPEWMQAFARFAHRGKFYLVICCLLGAVAFPFVAMWIIVLLLWRLAFGRFYR